MCVQRSTQFEHSCLTRYTATSYIRNCELAVTLYAHVFIMYTLKLIYSPEPRTQTLKESVTYCATIDLYVDHGIESFQTSASEISFERDRDRTLACLLLSASTSFTPVIV